MSYRTNYNQPEYLCRTGMPNHHARLSVVTSLVAKFGPDTGRYILNRALIHLGKVKSKDDVIFPKELEIQKFWLEKLSEEDVDILLAHANGLKTLYLSGYRKAAKKLKREHRKA